MDRLYIASNDDQAAVASILFKNGYTVRKGSARRPKSKSYDYFVEYERNVPVKRGEGPSDG